MSFDVSGNAYDRFMGRYALELAPAFADFVGVHEGKVVDVGCGSGILTEELARRVGAENVAAADPSPLLETCRERVPEADVRPGTAEELPWTDDTFDAALGRSAGLGEVEAAPLDVSIRYESFSQLWSTFELGAGPAGEFCASLPEADRETVRDEYQRRLGNPAGSFDLPAQAWVLRGSV